MVNMTLSIPADLKKEMDKFPELNWSAVARQAIKHRLEMIKHFEKFAEKSELTEEDAIRLGREVSKAVARRHYL